MAHGQDFGGPGRKRDLRDLVLSDQPVWRTGRILVGQAENEIFVISALLNFLGCKLEKSPSRGGELEVHPQENEICQILFSWG